MFRILDDFQKIYYEPMSLPKNVEKSEAMARIQYSECNHYKDRDTKARDCLRFILQFRHYKLGCANKDLRLFLAKFRSAWG